MDISTAALASLIALAIVVIISCVNEDLHVGYLSIAYAIIVGGIFGGLNGAAILRYFPVSLFMILAGVTFLFAMAQENGTMEKLTTHAIRLCKGNNAFIPVAVYIISTILTMIGPGNIAIPALLAPVMMPVAARLKMSAFLMTLIIVGSANGAGMSPIAPTGIIINGLLEKMAPALGFSEAAMASIGWKVFFNSFVAQGFVNFGGFLVMGGFAWMRMQRGLTVNLEDFAPKPEPFTNKQLGTIATIVALVILVITPGLPGMKTALPKGVLLMLANVGTVAFILSGFMLMFSVADSKKAIKLMPWGVIMMVCGVTVLIEVMDKSGGLNAMVKMIGAISNPASVNFWLGLFTGIISAYSSSSGVVVPMFMPLVPGLITEIGGGNSISMISTIVVGSHLVDTSPLSTLGAICIACADDSEDKSKLFRKLLIWGLSMSIVGAIICYIIFGLLNI